MIFCEIFPYLVCANLVSLHVTTINVKQFRSLSFNENQLSFSCYVGKHVYSCHPFLADYISPMIALLHQSDHTIQ
jgi:hypothetical protein